MDLRQLLYFSTVAETLNFRRAAERLNMSQPPLTVAIHKLEAELGAPLFLRNPRGVALTSAGMAALEAARGALAQTEQVRRAVREEAAGGRGSLAVGFVSSAIYGQLPRLLRAYRARHPGVEFVLEEGTSADIACRLRSRDLDVGLVRHPLLEAAELETLVLETDTLVAALPAAHPLADRARLELELLAEEPLITFPKTSVLYGAILAGCHQAGFSPRVAQEAAQAPTILSLVQSGLGIGLTPSLATRHAPDEVRLAPLASPIRIEMCAAAAAQGASAPAHRFMTLCRDLTVIDPLSEERQTILVAGEDGR